MDEKKQTYDKIAAGKRIRECRKKLGFSRKKIAEKLGKTEKYYGDIERGYCGMSVETMTNIANCLGISHLIIWFWGKKMDKNYRKT